MSKISIIGAGAWGTALACLSRRAKHEVMLWALEDEVIHAINSGEGNPMYLPGVKLDDGIHATQSLSKATAESQAVFSVVPSQFFRSIAEKMASSIDHGTPLVICSEASRLKLVPSAEIAREMIPIRQHWFCLGPLCHGRSWITIVALAASNMSDAEFVTNLIGTHHFRPYPMDDPIGAEIGGAAKNVLAIACGIVIGRKLGANTRAAILTRGLFEMAMLGVAKGAKARTFMGLSGLGDLTLTCNGPQSRNMSLGIELGEGYSLPDILSKRNTIAEGVETARGIIKLAQSLDVEIPIMKSVYQILHKQIDIDQIIENLLDRPFSHEFKGLD